MTMNNITVRESEPLKRIVCTAPKGEYYLYTDMAQALGGATCVTDALVEVHGASLAQEPSAPQPEALDLLADMAQTSAKRGDYLDILANAAASHINNLTPSAGSRAEVKVSTPDGFEGLSVGRLVIDAHAGASAQVVVRLASCGRLVLQCKVNVAEGANVDIVFLQDGADDKVILTRTTVDLLANAKANLNFVNLNPELARNEVRCGLHAAGAHLEMGGLYVVSGEGRVDNESLVEHLSAHTSSNQLFKGIADDKARMAFGGLILVKPDAQRVDANQTNRHMLASRNARAYAKPQLEIYADDVKCSHGATTGQIDPQQLFYMQQRGIDERTARKLLSAAFVGEVVDRIPMEDVRTALHDKIVG